MRKTGLQKSVSSYTYPNTLSLVLLQIGCIFILMSAAAQDLPLNFSFDDLRQELNPASPDPEYLTHDGHYRHYFESLFSQELLNLTNHSASYQGTVQYQWFPDFKKDYTFKWNFGAAAFIDKFGPTEHLLLNIRAGLNWISPGGDMIAAGVRLGYQHQKVDLSGTELLQFGDPVASLAYYQKSPDLGFGLYFNKRVLEYHDVFFGISIPHLYTLDYGETDKGFITKGRSSALAGANIYYADYGYLEPMLHY
ncbi:MAG: hypothetical protein HKN76_00590, partial [Saprospiraceae bacterium]|nr:hypothetical protein [Saprospiraceae bacterium]